MRRDLCAPRAVKERAGLRSDAHLAALEGLGAEEVEAYISAHARDLPAARSLLAALAKAVVLLLRERGN